MSSNIFASEHTDKDTYFPCLLGTRGAVTSEHYLATQAAADVLKSGGNAVDAAAGAVFVEGVVNPHMHTLGGECPMLIHMAGSKKVVVINGNTAAPAKATPQAYRDQGFTQVPDEGIFAAGVPAALGALLSALIHYGRLSFNEIIASALNLAREGYPLHRGQIYQPRFGIKSVEEKFRQQWPASAKLYLPQGKLPSQGQIFKNSCLADMFDHLCNVERKSSQGRVAGLRAVLDEFYRGEVATEIAHFSKAHEGFLARSDLEHFETYIEEPVSLNFHNTQIYKCGPWNQGPALLQALAILEGFDLKAMGHNSANYLHTLIETIKLAYADREQYYADPNHIEVPMQGLLSKDYAAIRAELIDPDKANAELRPGDPGSLGSLLPVMERLGGKDWGPGTVHVDVIDAEGNMVAMTPSGGWIKGSEVISSLGFPLGTRLMTFYLAPEHHPNLVAPFKQPRTTISPSLAFRDGQPWMVFGSMGGDKQDQWQLQFLLNRVIFDMTIQQAIEAAKCSSEHFPGFFAPHEAFPNRVCIEPRIKQDVLKELSRRGHDLDVTTDWTEGYLLAAARDASGVLEAGCDPRGCIGDVFPAFALCW